MVGRARGAATQALTDAHVKYKTDFQDSDQPEGTVLSQTHSNEVVNVGTVIGLVIAQAPAPTPTTTATGPATTAPPTTAP